MKKQTKKFLLYVVLLLSLIGIVTSGYLVYEHFSLDSSFCDVTDTISCSLVNASKYSEMFEVPVAVFGVIWFIFLIAFTYFQLKAPSKKQEHKYIFANLVWSIIGLLSVFYLVWAEIMLKAICPFCTVIHVIILITIIIFISFYKKEKVKFPKFKDLWKNYNKWIIAVLLLNVLAIVWFNLPESEPVNYGPLAQCMTESGVNMYGSFRCGVCAKTRDMFGDSFQYINEIECHPQGENSQTQLCLEKEIEGTPTWIFEPNGVEQNRHTGFLSIEELAQFSGCTNISLE